ncbi:12677_t:CDS:2 [Funneliformis geosporum]|nr:12677_t:CDS:2 [Funneliformis geosporum]
MDMDNLKKIERIIHIHVIHGYTDNTDNPYPRLSTDYPYKIIYP